MNINHLLAERRERIVKQWFETILEGYPANTSHFLKGHKNQFSNPVGHTIYEGIEGLLDGIITGAEPDSFRIYLDNIIKIRAVQDFTPSRAVGFIFILKDIIREELHRDVKEQGLYDALLLVESRIDELAGMCFDLYMNSREKLYELSANEMRNWTAKLIERANKVLERRGKN